MDSQRDKRLRIVGLSALIGWLIVGPYLCLIGIDSMLTEKPSGSFWFYSPAWAATGIAGIAIFFLPHALWKRVFVFVVYVPIVGVVLPLAAVVIACIVFHDCL